MIFCNNYFMCDFTGWAKKTGLFFRLDNFVTVSTRMELKVAQMQNVSCICTIGSNINSLCHSILTIMMLSLSAT